jgi:hypothetical protein
MNVNKGWITGVQIPAGAGIYVFFIMSRLDLGPTQSPGKGKVVLVL